MAISDQELRDLVRESVARHMLSSGRTAGSGRVEVTRHASHLLLPVAPGSGGDEGLCVIEPMVRCNHCGYCQSYGH